MGFYFRLFKSAAYNTKLYFLYLIYKYKKMDNYIGIDISLNSTAVFIENDNGKFILSFTNKKDNNIYIKELDRCGVIFSHISRSTSADYSINEILKITHYNMVSDLLVNKVIELLDVNKKTYCQIEGYSFSKNTSSILDIVSLSTLIRSSLIKNIKNIDISIISPSTLKLEACKLVYKPVNIGAKKPKFVYINNQGIAGGCFKKPHMYRAIIEGNIDTPIYDMLVSYKHLMDREKIPNPIEDIIDATFACKIKIKNIQDANR